MNLEYEKDLEEIRGAIARGYCAEENAGKTVDPVLMESQTKEIQKLLTKNNSMETLATQRDFEKLRLIRRGDMAAENTIFETVNFREIIAPMLATPNKYCTCDNCECDECIYYEIK